MAKKRSNSHRRSEPQPNPSKPAAELIAEDRVWWQTAWAHVVALFRWFPPKVRLVAVIVLASLPAIPHVKDFAGWLRSPSDAEVRLEIEESQKETRMSLRDELRWRVKQYSVTEDASTVLVLRNLNQSSRYPQWNGISLIGLVDEWEKNGGCKLDDSFRPALESEDPAARDLTDSLAALQRLFSSDGDD